MTNVLEQFRSNYSATQAEEMSIEEYLELCKRDPLAYATAAERMLGAIGEPEMVDTRNDPRLSRIFANKVIKIYPAFAEFYGMEDAIEQVVSYFRHAAQGLEEKKQILYLLGPVGGGKSSIAERLKQLMEQRAVLRDQGLAGERIAARPVQRDEDGADAREASTASRAATCTASCRPWAVKRLRRIRRRHPQVQASSSAIPSVLKQVGDRQDRAGRREQPGHLVAGRQGRHPQARDLRAGRPGRLQLLRRPVPGQPGPARVRRDVQGADQGAAPAADGHPGRQLQGHRRLRRDPVRRHRAGALATRASGRPSATTRTTRPSSTASTSSRCRTACA